jgi:hypothetical protein
VFEKICFILSSGFKISIKRFLLNYLNIIELIGGVR